MRNFRFTDLSIIILSVAMAGCNNSENKERVTQIENAAIAAELCLASLDGDQEIDKLVQRQVINVQRLSAIPASWVELGSAWITKSKLSGDPGFYLHAKECAEHALAIDVNFTPAKELQVRVLLNNHEFDAARVMATDIVSRDPDNRYGWAALSDAYLELGDIDQAESAVNNLSNLQLGMAAFTRSSYLHWLRGDIKSANHDLLMALQRRDSANSLDVAWTFVQAGDISWQQHDLSGAKALYLEALKWEPVYPSALVGLAHVALAQDDAKEAITLLTKIEPSKVTAIVLWLLADAYEMTGNLSDAEKTQTEFITLARTSDPFLLARFLSTKNRDLRLAIDLIENEKQTRGGAYIEDAYAWALYRLGRFAEAQVAMDKAVAWGTQDAKLLYHLGAIKIAVGDTDKGKSLLRQALMLHPDFDYTGAQEAKLLLTGHRDPKNV